MKNYFMNYCMKTINSSTLNYSEEKLEEIEYGLEAVYILITKSIIIFTMAYFLHIVIPLLIFLIIYNVIRMPSFGLHATKSIYCLLSSIVIFIGGTFLSVYVSVPLLLKVIIGIYCILRMFKNAPADTYKRPIVNQKRRDTYKILSTLLAILFVFFSVFIQEQFLSNAFLIALIIQVCIISPYIYKLFHLPYDNYKDYILNNGLN
ncbi:MAG: accessory gene regulator B family protein [Bacilli bacterium]|nr:accessory gene regulator B family protein [Bacilli bacterium]